MFGIPYLMWWDYGSFDCFFLVPKMIFIKRNMTESTLHSVAPTKSNRLIR